MSLETKVDMGNGNVVLLTHNGVVTGDKNWSSTEVSGSGGSGYITQGTGYVSGVAITSTTTQHQEIHVRVSGDHEIGFRLEDKNVLIHEGQAVSVLQAQREGPHPVFTVALLNHTTGTLTVFPEKAKLFRRPTGGPKALVFLMAAIGIYAAMASSLNPFFIAKFPGLGRLNLVGVLFFGALTVLIALPALIKLNRLNGLNRRLADTLWSATQAMKKSSSGQQ